LTQLVEYTVWRQLTGQTISLEHQDITNIQLIQCSRKHCFNSHVPGKHGLTTSQFAVILQGLETKSFIG